MKKIVYAILALTLFAVFGCSGDDSVTAPNSNAFQPKGTVTGVLTDRITNQPLANAKVMILDKSAITNSAGMFTITDVPANTPVGNEPADGIGSNTYNAVIDMTAINADITTFNTDATAYNAVTTNTVKKSLKAFYPAFAYSTVKVKYDSLGDASPGVDGASNATNHDTPVDGFVASMAPTVGKLDGNLQIQVVDGNAQVVQDATVKLYAAGGAQNTASTIDNVLTDAEINTTTGNMGHLVATATTDAAGLVTFSNVEAGAMFFAEATKGNKAADGVFFAPGDGDTSRYLNQQATGAFGVNDALVLTSLDTVRPKVIETTPANLADIAAGTTVVKFKFSEPIKANNYALATTEAASQNGGLWSDVVVNFDGPKAGNLPYTLTWNTGTDLTELSVTFTTVAASKYTVSIDGTVGGATVFAVGKLVDSDNAAIPANANGNGTVTFSTSGGNVPTAPVLVRTNDTTIDWAPVANAYQYRVVVAKYRNGVLVDPDFAVSTQSDTRYVLPFAPFTDGQIPLTYKVKVIAMGTANVVSAGTASTTEIALNDTAAPVISSRVFLTPLLGGSQAVPGAADVVTTYTVTVDFTEAGGMKRADVQDPAKWVITRGTATNGGLYLIGADATKDIDPTVTSVVYNTTTQAILTFSIKQNAAANGTWDPQHVVFTFTGSDVNGNAVMGSADSFVAATVAPF